MSLAFPPLLVPKLFSYQLDDASRSISSTDYVVAVPALTSTARQQKKERDVESGGGIDGIAFEANRVNHASL